MCNFLVMQNKPIRITFLLCVDDAPLGLFRASPSSATKSMISLILVGPSGDVHV